MLFVGLVGRSGGGLQREEEVEEDESLYPVNFLFVMDLGALYFQSQSHFSIQCYPFISLIVTAWDPGGQTSIRFVDARIAGCVFTTKIVGIVNFFRAVARPRIYFSWSRRSHTDVVSLACMSFVIV